MSHSSKVRDQNMTVKISKTLKSTLLGSALLLALAACGGEQDRSAAAPAEPDPADSRLGDSASETMQEAAADVETAAVAGMDSAEEAMEDMSDEAMNTAAPPATSPGEPATAAADDGDPCTLTVEVGDSIAYSTDAMTVPSSCNEVTVTITHTGNLPAVAMGHNWVLVPSEAADSIAQAAMSAGADNGYVPDDDRIVAATGIVGGGESDSVSFTLDRLEDGTDYLFVCTFPGHSYVMRGSFTVSD